MTNTVCSLPYYHQDDAHLNKEERRRICPTCYAAKRRVRLRHQKAQGEQRKRSGTVLDMLSCFGLFQQAVGILLSVFGSASPSASVMNEHFFLDLVRPGANGAVARDTLSAFFHRINGLRLTTPAYVHANKQQLLDFFERVCNQDRVQLLNMYGFVSDTSTFRLVTCVRQSCCATRQIHGRPLFSVGLSAPVCCSLSP
jgi:hypothetical protein